MSVLVDREIRKLCTKYIADDSFMPMLEPFSEGVSKGEVISYGLTSCGYDLRLGHKVLIFKNSYNETMDPKRLKRDTTLLKRLFDEIDDMKDGQYVVVPPHSYILAYSLEYIRMPRWLVGTCVGKSTYARCGIIVNTTPLEPEWEGHLTIEVGNISPVPVNIYVGEGIAQLRFDELAGRCERSYADKGGKYQGQGAEPVPAKVKE